MYGPYPGTAQCVLNFSGQKSVQDGGTMVSVHYDNSLTKANQIHKAVNYNVHVHVLLNEIIDNLALYDTCTCT